MTTGCFNIFSCPPSSQVEDASPSSSQAEEKQQAEEYNIGDTEFFAIMTAEGGRSSWGGTSFCPTVVSVVSPSGLPRTSSITEKATFPALDQGLLEEGKLALDAAHHAHQQETRTDPEEPWWQRLLTATTGALSFPERPFEGTVDEDGRETDGPEVDVRTGSTTPPEIRKTGPTGERTSTSDKPPPENGFLHKTVVDSAQTKKKRACWIIAILSTLLLLGVGIPLGFVVSEQQQRGSEQHDRDNRTDIHSQRSGNDPAHKPGFKPPGDGRRYHPAQWRRHHPAQWRTWCR